MKRIKFSALFILAISLCAVHPATAAVNLRWKVETSRLQPVAFDAVRGETLALEASFNSYGAPLSMAERTYSVFYQTNGMGSAWWTAPATVSSNTVAATITPYMVPSSGTSTYPVTLNGFLGSTGDIYRAAFTIRFRNGPGATPNVIEQPTPVLDLAHTVVINQPWPTTNDFRAATNDMQTALKNYVDEQIVGAGVVSPQIVTNIVDGKIADKRDKTDLHVYSQPVTRWFWSGSDAPQGWLDAANAIGNDASQPTHEGSYWECRFDYADYRVIYSNEDDENAVSLSFTLWYGWGSETEPYGTVYCNLTTMPSTVTSRLATTNDITSTVTKSYVESLGISSGVTSVNSKTGAVQLVASDVGAASESSVSTLSLGYTRLFNFVTGATNASFSATNYPPTAESAASKTHYHPEVGMDFSTVPASLQLNEYRDGSWRTVVDTRDWTVWYYNFKEIQLTNEIARLTAANSVMSNELENAKAWANRTANGIENPMSDTLVVDRPNMWLMADYSWQKCVRGSNQCFVIRANNVAISGGSNTNGFLEICDAFGTPYIRVNKSSEQFADPVFEDISFNKNEGAWYVVFGNSTKPEKGGANTEVVKNGSGKSILLAEENPDCPATITWPDSPDSHSGHWIMKAVPKPVNGVVPKKMFFGAQIKVAGKDYVEYLKEASFAAGIRVGTNVYNAVESGNQLIWTKRND